MPYLINSKWAKDETVQKLIAEIELWEAVPMYTAFRKGLFNRTLMENEIVRMRKHLGTGPGCNKIWYTIWLKKKWWIFSYWEFHTYTCIQERAYELYRMANGYGKLRTKREAALYEFYNNA